jgi:hypothetical protein
MSPSILALVANCRHLDAVADGQEEECPHRWPQEIGFCECLWVPTWDERIREVIEDLR